MSAACRSFRELLELKLSGRVAQSELVVLSWHEHLLRCGACRELLEAEEALELLLASLPEPNLPPELARRVISRLRDAQRHDLAETGLDALLDLDRSEAVPADLAASVLARLRAARASASASVDAVAVSGMTAAHRAESNESRLDALLDLDRAALVPDGLAARTLARLRSVRHDEARARRAPRFAVQRIRFALAVAALVVASWIAWMIWRRAPATSVDTRANVAHQDGERIERAPTDSFPLTTDSPEPQMLAVLDVLEQWDLLMHADIDVLLSTLDPVEFESIEEPPAEPETPPEAAPKEPRSKG